MTTALLQKLNKNGEEVLEVFDAANNVSRLTRDFNDVKKKFTDISSIININFFIYYVTLRIFYLIIIM